MEVLAEREGSPARPRVALLAGDHGHPAVEGLRAAMPRRAHVTVVTPGLTAWETWGHLAGVGPVQLLVDVTGDRDDEVKRFCTYFRLVAAGGTYVVPGGPSSPPDVDDESRLPAFLQRLTADGDLPELDHADRRSLARSVSEVRTATDHVAVTRRGRTLAKMRELEMNAALAVDPTRGRVVAELPAASFRSRCAMRVSGSASPGPTKERYAAPKVFLREYTDVVCGPISVVVQRGLVTPDAYRHPRQRRLTNRALKDVGERFVRPPYTGTQPARLDGTFFHLDNEWRSGFGHALTDQLSRLWAWEDAKRTQPDLRALVGINRGRGVAEWEQMLYAAAGIDLSDIELVDGPVRVSRLLSATPMFSMPAYVHPGIVHTWDRVGAALRAGASTVDHPSRIFCSRRHRRRACTNRAEVETLFADHGFRVVFPEELPLPDQVQLFHCADVVAGFAGSGMFTTLFSNRPKHLILLRPDTYRAGNEYMIAAVRGHQLDQVVSTVDPSVYEDRPNQAVRAPFACDMDREGAWLRTILQEL